MTRVRQLVAEYGTEEQEKRLDRIMGDARRVPPPNNYPVEYATYQSEALVILFEVVGEIKEAQKPRPRGRPPKSVT